MPTLPYGHTTPLPGLPGRWSVWSGADVTPGGYFFVPANDEARQTGHKYVVVKVIYPRSAAHPEFKLLTTH